MVVSTKDLKAYLVALDMLLTGNSEAEALKMVKQLNGRLLAYAEGEEYYLSDGGYSRIYIEFTWDTLRVTSNSLDRVKEKWDTKPVQSLVKGIKSTFATLREELDTY